MADNEIEEMVTPCPYCGAGVTSYWVTRGMLSRPEYDLVGDLIFHSVCWDKQVAEHPTEAQSE